jgi:peroxiredoxin Q/BCP
VILGASFDDVAANKAFADKFDYPFKLLCDVDRKLGTAYGALDAEDPGYPRRISYLIGPDRKIERVYDPVKAATHPEQVLTDLG